LSGLHCRDVATEEAADTLAQAIACAAPIVAARPRDLPVLVPWLSLQLDEWEQFVLLRATDLSTQDSVPSTKHTNSNPSHPLSIPPSLPPSAHLYDHFLQHHRRDSRRRGGVFFTPQPIADFIVAHVDWLLRDECHIPGGLSSHSEQCTSHTASPVI